MDEECSKLALFQTDAGMTMAFGERTYFISIDDPFHNIANKALKQGVSR